MNFFTLINSSSSSQCCQWCCMLCGVGSENMDVVDVDTNSFFPRLHTVWTVWTFNELEQFFLSLFPLNWITLLIHLTLLLLIQILLFHTVYGTCMSIKFFMSPFRSSHLAITFVHFSIPQLTICCLRYQPKCTYIRSGTSTREKFKSIVNISMYWASLSEAQSNKVN